MFDIGFWEIMFIAVITLVVVGPERLPKLAYTLGKWLGKGRSMLTAVKSEIDKEIKAEELKEILEKHKKSINPLEEIIEETTDAISNFKEQTHKTANDAKQGFSDETSNQEQQATEQSTDHSSKA